MGGRDEAVISNMLSDFGGEGDRVGGILAIGVVEVLILVDQWLGRLCGDWHPMHVEGL